MDQCRQEIAAQRQWREATVRQLESLWQERDQGAASGEQMAALQREMEALREERDAARERLRMLTPSSGQGVAVLVGILAAVLGALAGVGAMLWRSGW